jgi:hypothetical protein
MDNFCCQGNATFKMVYESAPSEINSRCFCIPIFCLTHRLRMSPRTQLCFQYYFSLSASGSKAYNSVQSGSIKNSKLETLRPYKFTNFCPISSKLGQLMKITKLRALCKFGANWSKIGGVIAA